MSKEKKHSHDGLKSKYDHGVSITVSEPTKKQAKKAKQALRDLREFSDRGNTNELVPKSSGLLSQSTDGVEPLRIIKAKGFPSSEFRGSQVDLPEGVIRVIKTRM